MNSLLMAMWVLPNVLRPLLWVPLACLLPVGIRACSRIQFRIRAEEAPARREETPGNGLAEGAG
jgi:hypothetical protein